MAKLSRLRLRFATAGFLAEARKQFAKSRPNEECPIKNLEDYPEAQRSSLMAAIDKAVTYAGSQSDQIFERWSEVHKEKDDFFGEKDE